jgi:hypothetical protein
MRTLAFLSVPDIIDVTLIRVSAVHPFIERNKRPAFDPVTFFRAMIERAKSAVAHDASTLRVPAFHKSPYANGQGGRPTVASSNLRRLDRPCHPFTRLILRSPQIYEWSCSRRWSSS